MLFTLLFAGATGLVCLMLYNSGILANTKTQVQNAADAGAYSAALLLARDHNFSAYTNRAMVANQVSVAQLVSLKSFLMDAAATHNRMGGFAHRLQSTLVPVVKVPWDIARQMPIPSIYNAYNNVAPTTVQTLDRLIRIFESAQQMHHMATAVNVIFTANEVVQKNDPKASITMASFQTAATAVQLNKWANNYTERHRANDMSAAADRFANVVVSNQSTDAFVRDRGSAPLLASWLSMPKAIACPGMIPVLTIYGFAHDGGTILSRNKRRWLALDATQGNGFVSCILTTPLGPIPVVYPLPADGFGGSGGGLAGSGGGYANDATGHSGNPSDARRFGGALRNPLVIIPAQRRFRSQGPGANMDSSNGGLQDYYRDVAPPTMANRPANQSAALNGGQVPLTIEVEHRAADIRTSSRVLGNAGATVSAPDTLKGGTMKALSSAHPYFFRARQDSSAFNKAGWRRADNRTELANLFNPYWQAQLVDRTEAERALSAGSP